MPVAVGGRTLRSRGVESRWVESLSGEPESLTGMARSRVEAARREALYGVPCNDCFPCDGDDVCTKDLCNEVDKARPVQLSSTGLPVMGS